MRSISEHLRGSLLEPSSPGLAGEFHTNAQHFDIGRLL